MGFWEDFLTPTAAQYTRAASSIDTAMNEYNTAMAQYRDFLDRESKVSYDRVVDQLAKTGKLTSTTAATAYSDIQGRTQQELANAQLQTVMQRASARSERAKLTEMAGAARTKDLINLGGKVAGAALTAYGMGAFAPAAAGAAGTAAAGTTAAGVGDMAKIAGSMGAEFKPMSAIPVGPAQTAMGLAPNIAARYNPTLTSIGESLMGVQGSPFTIEAMRNRYPDMFRTPEVPAPTDWMEFIKAWNAYNSGK